MEWVAEAEEHLRLVARQERDRHAREMAALTFEVERLRAELDTRKEARHGE